MAGKRRVAVVLFNLGGPDSLAAVRPFLFNLFNDPAIIALPSPFRQILAAIIAWRRAKTAAANYAYIGGSSPLLKETEAQAAALAEALRSKLPDAELKIVIAMRYWRPDTREAAKAVEAFGPDDVVLLPLYPQFSSSTTGSSLAEWARTYRGPGRAHTVCCYYAEPGFVRAHARRIEETWQAAGRPEAVRVLFSAHGLPERNVQAGDPYQWQVERTCEAIAAQLKWASDWRICYQSRVGPLKWLGPYTTESIEEACASGVGVLIDPVAFVSEHVETLVELDRDYAELAEAAGCDLYLRAPAVGVDEAFIEGLAETAVRSLERPGVCPEGRPCQGAWRGCPLQVRGNAG